MHISTLNFTRFTINCITIDFIEYFIESQLVEMIKILMDHWDLGKLYDLQKILTAITIKDIHSISLIFFIFRFPNIQTQRLLKIYHSLHV